MKQQATTGQYCIIQPISLCCLPWSAIGKGGTVGSVSPAFSGQGASARSDAIRLSTGKYNHCWHLHAWRGIHEGALKDDTPSGRRCIWERIWICYVDLGGVWLVLEF
jgi:hypothetical protein